MTSIMRHINMLSRAQNVYRADKLQQPGLSPGQHSYVLAVCHHPGMSQEELARHLCINKSNVARALASLEENDYVERRPDERDRRQFRIYPTARMLSLLPAVQVIVEDWNDYLTEGLSQEEMTAFRATLEKISQRARQYVGGKEDGE